MHLINFIQGSILLQHVDSTNLNSDYKNELAQNLIPSASYVICRDKDDAITKGYSRLCELETYLDPSCVKYISKNILQSSCYKPDCKYQNKKNNGKCYAITDFKKM